MMGNMNGSRAMLTWRVLAFVGIPVWLAFGFLQFSAARRETAALAFHQDQMRAVLNRVATKAHPRKRFDDLLSRLAQCNWSTRSLTLRAARLVKTEGGALECLVFDRDGHLLRLPGLPPRPRRAAERFLQAVIDPTAKVPSSLIAAFARNPAAARMLGQSPGALVDLVNGDTCTYAGWWPLRDRHKRTCAHILALVHRRAIHRDELVDRAVRETRRLVGNFMMLGWQQPTATGQLRPEGQTWPASLAAQLAAMPYASTETPTPDGCLVRQCTENGELLFAVDRWPQNTPDPLVTVTAPWLVGAAVVLLALAYLGLCGEILPPVFGLHGKLAWLFIAGGGLPLALLWGTAVIDRDNREMVLIETRQRQHLDQLCKIDQAYINHLYAFQRLYLDLGQRLSQRQTDQWPPQLQRAFSRILARARGRIQGLVAVAAGRQLLCQAVGSADRLAASKAFMRDMAFNALGQIRGERAPEVRPGTVGSERLSAVFGGRARMGTSGRERINFFNVPGQQMIHFTSLIGPRERPTALISAIHGAFHMQSLFLQRTHRRWPKAPANPLVFAALPNAGRPDLPPIPTTRAGADLQLRQLQHLVLTSRRPEHQRLRFGRREYLVSAMRGRYLDGYVLMVAQPFATIESETQRLHRHVSVMAVAALVCGLLLARVAGALMLAPIRRLGIGLTALTDGDFSSRIDLDHDTIAEFARLGTGFNHLVDGVQDLQIARTVQTHLWPATGVAGPDWRLDGRCDTATSLGGDYYDWLQVDADRWVICLGDVAGHGIPAALITAAAKVELAYAATQANSPLAIVTSMNTGLRRQAGAIRPMSLWLGMFSPGSRLLRFSVAGHPYAIVGSPGRAPQFAGVPGYPLASRRQVAYTEGSCDLAAGGYVLLYSDGLPEATNPNGESFGYERLAALADELAKVTASPAARLAELHRRVRHWSGQPRPADDMTTLWLDLPRRPEVSP